MKKRFFVRLAMALAALFNSYMAVRAVGISFVYNMKISETTVLEECHKGTDTPGRAVATFVGQRRVKYEEGRVQHINGLIGALVYAPRCYYLRAEFGAGHVRDKTRESCFSRTQSDDVLLSGGYTHNVSERTKCTFSGLLGIPTHQDLSLEGIQFGYAHTGIGAEIDGAFAYTASKAHKLHGAARYIHFLRRDAHDKLGACFKYKISDLIDFLIFNSSTWGKHALDLGYSAFWFIHPTICPPAPGVLEKDRYSRNSFFGVYRYRFVPNVTFVAGFSYGFDGDNRPFDSKQVLTYWLALAARF